MDLRDAQDIRKAIANHSRDDEFHKCPDCDRLHRHFRKYALYTNEWAVEYTQETVNMALAMLAVSPPSGDDASFDYYPNCLEAVKLLYDAMAQNDFQVPDDPSPQAVEFRGQPVPLVVIPEWDLHHCDETLGQGMANRIAFCFALWGVPMTTNREADDWFEADDPLANYPFIVQE